MEPTEIAIAVGALVAIVLVLFVIRRASEKSASETAKGVRKRIRDDRRDARREEDGGRDSDDRGRGAARETPHPGPPPAGGREELDEDLEGEEAEEEPEAEEEEEILKKGLAKTRGGFVARLGRLFSRKKIGDELLDELEQVLFTADIGPRTAEKIFSGIKNDLSKDDLEDPDAIWSKIREQSATILDVESRPLDFDAEKPFVLLTIGVNGVGKTTTIGKIAAKLGREDKKVLLAAGDTFRAAAVEQLEIWADRAGADIVKGKSGGDPSSVIFDAIKKGVDEGYDVVIADTAGRLHTKVDLMDELRKVGRACDKALPGAPHETWLVLDATTGQNAIAQAELFKKAMDITGIVLTKLDGTAKGGVILGICDELKVPVRYIGIGEGVDDLRVFDPVAFVDALYEHETAADAA